MIHHFLILNTSGLPRLTKHYIPLSLSMQQQLLTDVFNKINAKMRIPESSYQNNNSNNAACCFIDVEQTHTEQQQQNQNSLDMTSKSSSDSSTSYSSLSSFYDRTSKIVFRGFATLYFIIVCDDAESELGLLDLIQVFVETLDKVFANVCELDIIFNSPKVHALLDEIIVGGTVLETDGAKVLQHVREMDKAEKLERAEGNNSSGGSSSSGGGSSSMTSNIMSNAKSRITGGMNQILGKPAFG